tara:strand:- start:1447 stop:2181 length:735 start_codon:yes stop_codon:yes gene_type:complete
MINLDNQKIFYEPFPHALFENVFDEIFYKKLCAEFPKDEKFENFDLDKQNFLKQKKFALNDNSNSFKSIIEKRNHLNELYQYLISCEFKNKIFALLEEKNISFPKYEKNQSFLKKFYKRIKNIRNYGFEFSMISTDEGFIKPHTDGPDKLISFVIPIVEDENISNIQNSGTKILEPIDDKFKYNYLNKTVPYEATKIIREIPFNKNQIFLFIKTHNSLHSVGPMKKNREKIQMRKSINFFIYKN